jgi:hypothetical protein
MNVASYFRKRMYVSENKLWKMYGPKMRKVSVLFMILQNKLSKFYRSPNVVTIGKSSYNGLAISLGWRRQGMHIKFLCGNLLESGHLVDQGYEKITM